MSDFKCPQCSSDNVQRLEVVYEQGTQNINTTSHSVGGGGGIGGGGFGGGLGSATTRTSGTAQTSAAKKAAPPAKKGTVSVLIGLLIVGAVIGAMFDHFIGLSIFLGLGFWGFTIFKKNSAYNNNVHPGLYQQWLKSWMCNKCGNIYEQG